MAAKFIPRAAFEATDSLPKSYFLGHHKGGLERMKAMLARIDLVFECRDYRVPLTSRNPMFEDALAGKERVIVHTKHDLGRSGDRHEDLRKEQIIRKWHHPATVIFSSKDSDRDARRILKLAKERSANNHSLLGTRMLVVGMPNVGKSTLINSLRRLGTGGGKVASTGAQPGVTRKIGTPVKIIEGSDSERTETVYLLDTPGVFVPYVPNAEAMLKLALCGSVKDTIIQPVLLADYLLYHINRVDPTIYSKYSGPTNSIETLLAEMARQTGRLQKGGGPDYVAIALWMIQKWRNGELGTFLLDEVADDGLQRKVEEERSRSPSFSSAVRSYKSSLKSKAKAAA